MISYDEAMRLAVADHLPPEHAGHWLSVAREIREASRRGDPFSACEAPHFAVQDVEAELCAHRLISVRLPGASSQWWHAGERTWCDGMPQRDRPTPLVSEAAQTAVLTLDDVRPCFACSLPVREVGHGWVHVETARAGCDYGAMAEGDRQTYAWPAAQE